MKKSTLGWSAVCICLSIATAVQAQADNLYSNAQYWGFYLDSCHKLDKALRTVQKQLDQRATQLFDNDITFNVNRMNLSIPNLAIKDRESLEFHACQQKLRNAKNLMVKVEAYKKQLDNASMEKSRRRHENSRFYKEALDLGFKDYTWLGSLSDDYRKFGDKKLEHWMILIDADCGRWFKATQYIKPYVIYSAIGGGYHTCSYRGPIAVLPTPGSKVKRGMPIDRKSYYVYEGIIDATALDGFPITQKSEI